jgi:hypothetical protein
MSHQAWMQWRHFPKLATSTSTPLSIITLKQMVSFIILSFALSVFAENVCPTGWNAELVSINPLPSGGCKKPPSARRVIYLDFSLGKNGKCNGIKCTSQKWRKWCSVTSSRNHKNGRNLIKKICAKLDGHSFYS